jgi:hypothetical protein
MVLLSRWCTSSPSEGVGFASLVPRFRLIIVAHMLDELFGYIHSATQGLAMRADKVAHHRGQRTRVVHDVAAV